MITLRRSDARQAVLRTGCQAWSSFRTGGGGLKDPFGRGFGALEQFDEHRLEAGARLWVRTADTVEVITYVATGGVTYKESAGAATTLRAGDFQRVTGSRPKHLPLSNASRMHAARLFQLVFRRHGATGAEPTEQRHFSTAQRRGGLRLIASGDAREDALRLEPDVRIYSAILDPGQHVVHELAPRRSAWLHVVEGEAIVDLCTLCRGDAASFAMERAVAFTALTSLEVLLLELAHLASAPL